MPNRSDYYSDLGVSRYAAPEDIRRAYHQAVHRLHPDVNEKPGDTERFLRIQEAYEVLIDLEKKAEYDSKLSPAAVKMSALYSRSSLPHIHEPQVIYVLLALDAPEVSDTRPNPPLNVCLVLDRSTSMKGERMDTVKTTAIELVRQLRSFDILSIVTFSDRAEVLIPAGRRPEGSEAEHRIQMIQTGGGTEIYRGLEAGFFEVRRNLSKSHISQLFLLTDGQTYGDESACMKISEQAGAVGVGISCLGIGDGWNDTFLDGLAARTGGNSIYVTQPNDIKRFLKQKFNSLMRVYAEHLSLDVHMEAGVELRDVFRIAPETGPVEATSALRLGNIFRGTSLLILLEFKLPLLPEGIEEFTFATGQLTFDTPSRPQPTSTVPIRLSRPVIASPEPEMPPPFLVRALSQLNLYRMQERAHQELAEGDIAGATRHLKNLATHLLSKGERELARTVLSQVEQIQENQTASEEGKKRIKYGTRALLLPSAQRSYNSEESLP
jgi:Ca-activated chloride channel family protein